MFGLLPHGSGCKCLECKPTESYMRIKAKLPTDEYGNVRPLTKGEERFMFIAGFIIPVLMFFSFVGAMIYTLLKQTYGW